MGRRRTALSSDETILVYDISRWGRFQDADESAYYEYVCRRSGVEIRYCAEQFENDGSVASTIVKTVKRAMAGEYSRELSAKVFAGQCRLIELGFRQGGHAGYGLRRRLVDQNGNPKATLAFGEQKSLQSDRVVLEPGRGSRDRPPHVRDVCARGQTPKGDRRHSQQGADQDGFGQAVDDKLGSPGADQ
jgi:DNA invertase Pin-like site-specific DNA recombinase